ncbi:MAG: glucuronate isomerase [Fusobacteriaceae bacterium]|nr:glucuronate isomerase [Fusobacteriaceae bacterium]MBN2839272.1 glucuronate isomerase [Fusobacteriaceae bacterium]
MKKFMDDNFLLESKTAEELYHKYAKEMPIYDYHCHLSPKEIYENKKFKNITEAWLGGDHYKWRAMRSNGVEEKYITGESKDYDKFMSWARTLPKAIGNPLYHWTHLELQKYFGIEEILSEKTAEVIWEKANKLILKDEFSARSLIKRSNVKVICTTDDPIDNLEYHIKLKEDKSFDVKVLPTFRPDKVVEIKKDDFISWVEKLKNVSEKEINSYSDLKNALVARIDFFHEVGCRISDHGLVDVPYLEGTEEEASEIFLKALNKSEITKFEENKYKTNILHFFGKEYAKRNWTMQIHFGALRNNNTNMFKKLGADTGFDSVNDSNVAYEISRILDSLEKENSLPKTILYTLNPKDNYVLGTMLGNFQGEGIKGKIQFGSGWWFNDNKDGMIEQMKALGNLGLLGNFVGMLTDSRSFLSYTRHDYFRRIMCNLIGQWVENGEYPYDEEILEEIIKGISFNNAKEYFGIEF